MTTAPAEGRCTDCGTAKPPAGALKCQACRMMRILGCPVLPYVKAEHTQEKV